MSDQPFQPLLAADTVAVPISAPPINPGDQLYAFLVAADLTKYYQVLSENDLTVQLLKSCSTEELKSLGLTLGSIKTLKTCLTRTDPPVLAPVPVKNSSNNYGTQENRAVRRYLTCNDCKGEGGIVKYQACFRRMNRSRGGDSDHYKGLIMLLMGVTICCFGYCLQKDKCKLCGGSGRVYLYQEGIDE